LVTKAIEEFKVILVTKAIDEFKVILVTKAQTCFIFCLISFKMCVVKVILYSYLILKEMNERITDS